MTTERKETLKAILLWTYRGIVSVSAYFIIDTHTTLKNAEKDIWDIKINMSLYGYQIKSTQADVSIMKMNQRDHEKEHEKDNTEIWKHFAEISKP